MANERRDSENGTMERKGVMDSRMNWSELVAAEVGIACCGVCRARSQGDPGSPQPSWIGRDYESGGIVFVLQNPGVAPDRLVWNQREKELSDLLSRFRTSGTVEAYRALVDEMHAQMQGIDGRGPQQWGRWRHPVSKCVPDCLAPSQFAWMNVVKYRTPGRSERDRMPDRDEQSHGLGHLQDELDLLKPRRIVTVGAVARDAVSQLDGDWLPPIFVGQRASSGEAFKSGAT